MFRIIITIILRIIFLRTRHGGPAQGPPGTQTQHTLCGDSHPWRFNSRCLKSADPLWVERVEYYMSIMGSGVGPGLVFVRSTQVPLDPSKNLSKPWVFLVFFSFWLPWTPPAPPKPSQNLPRITFETLLKQFWTTYVLAWCVCVYLYTSILVY